MADTKQSKIGQTTLKNAGTAPPFSKVREQLLQKNSNFNGYI